MILKILILKILILRLETGRLRLKKGMNFPVESFDMRVVVAFMHFGSDSAIEVVDNLVEVL